MSENEIEDLQTMKNGFFLKGNCDEAVLLLHGFGGTPVELLLAARSLNSIGLNVIAPRISGHGLSMEEERKSSYQDWIKFTRDEYMKAKNQFKTLYVLGYSMGGALAMLLGSEFAVDGIILYEPAIRIMVPFASLSYLLYPTKMKYTWPSSSYPEHTEKYLLGPSGFYYKSLADLLTLAKLSRKVLKSVTSPLLVFYSLNDHLVSKKGIDEIMSECSSSIKVLKTFTNSSHSLPIDVDKKHAFKITGEFILYLERNKNKEGK
ncbi:MAG: alpha/beta fold hydrolase [Bacilli bacterium]